MRERHRNGDDGGQDDCHAHSAAATMAAGTHPLGLGAQGAHIEPAQGEGREIAKRGWWVLLSMLAAWLALILHAVW
jgi:hypothetical protein